jgi:hypothetical protein
MGAVGARAGTDKGNEKEDDKSGGPGQEHLILCRRRQISNGSSSSSSSSVSCRVWSASYLYVFLICVD